jgi:hypothetical protein
MEQKMIRSDEGAMESRQLQEQQVWLRTLDYIQQETIQLKNSLATIIKSKIDNETLEKIEYYQNEFLKKDTIVALLRHDIAKQNKMQAINAGSRNIVQKQETLRRDMELVEKEFSKLKFNYYSFLESETG